jgi:hypothetical protein
MKDSPRQNSRGLPVQVMGVGYAKIIGVSDIEVMGACTKNDDVGRWENIGLWDIFFLSDTSSNRSWGPLLPCMAILENMPRTSFAGLDGVENISKNNIYLGKPTKGDWKPDLASCTKICRTYGNKGLNYHGRKLNVNLCTLSSLNNNLNNDLRTVEAWTDRSSKVYCTFCMKK